MRRLGPFLRKALSPRAPVLALLLLVSAVGLTAVFTRGLEETGFAYAIYATSAYATAAAVWWAVRLLRRGRALLHRNALLHRYMTDLDFKARGSLYLSLSVTLLYCIYKGALAIYFHSTWLGAMAFYYLVLGLTRFLLLCHLRGGRDDPVQAFRKYRACGDLLLILTISLGAVSFYTVYEDRAVSYPGSIIYGAAGFAFYNLSMGFYNLLRYRRLKNPIYSASKILTLAAALVSMYFLQASMFAAFGNGEAWERYMNMGTGACVFLMIAAMALSMIRTGGRAAAQSRQREGRGENFER